MDRISARAALVRLRAHFPEREFLMRSEGRVRFIRLSTRLQMQLCAGVAALALGWVGTLATVALLRLHDSFDQQSLLNRAARVESAEKRVGAYRRNLDSVAADLRRRQDFIEKMVEAHVGELPADHRAGETVSDSSTEAGKAVSKISAAVPEAAPLARMEARQLAFAEQLTRWADRRATGETDRLRRLGLNPAMLLAAQNNGEAEGGPLLRLATESDGGLDPRFARLGASLARMSALDAGLTRVPQVLPARMDYISSGFGYRADPFTHAGAFHPGLDFRGPTGAPIYAAAPGTVSFAGQRSGYGNCVEVTHGPGLVTRYAHMSAFRARVGQQVVAGQQIGAIGSTGRSTGPHLHFEVRINDRPVNPRPFLEVRLHVPEKIGAGIVAGAADD